MQRMTKSEFSRLVKSEPATCILVNAYNGTVTMLRKMTFGKKKISVSDHENKLRWQRCESILAETDKPSENIVEYDDIQTALQAFLDHNGNFIKYMDIGDEEFDEFGHMHPRDIVFMKIKPAPVKPKTRKTKKNTEPEQGTEQKAEDEQI